MFSHNIMMCHRRSYGAGSFNLASVSAQIGYKERFLEKISHVKVEADIEMSF